MTTLQTHNDLHTVTPYLQVKGGDRLIDFLKQVFEAQEISRKTRADGTVMHAQVKIGDSALMLADTTGTKDPVIPAAIYIYVDDVDFRFHKAVTAGAKELYAPADQPWGDRGAGVTDAFGNTWYLAAPTAKTSAESSHPQPSDHATPYLVVRNASEALEFYKRAFGAEEVMRLTEPGGRVGHAEIRIGKAEVMLADEYPECGYVGPQTLGGTTVSLHLYVDNVDALVQRAVDAGAKLAQPIKDEFYGDRTGQVEDPYGHRWQIATRREEVPVKEMQRRWEDLMAKSPVTS